MNGMPFDSEIFILTLVLGVYIAACALYRKTRVIILSPLFVSIFSLIIILQAFGIEYEVFERGSRFIHFMMGPAVVALGYTLFEQMKYLKGNVVSILTSVAVGSIVGIVSVIAVCKLMGADDVMIYTLEPKSVTIPIALGIVEKSGGIPSITTVVIVIVGLFGSIAGPPVLKALGIEDRIAKGLALGSASHAVGTTAAIQLGAVEGAISGLAIGLMGVATAIFVPVINAIMKYFGVLL